VKSGPDVFADALVPLPPLLMPGALISKSPASSFSILTYEAVKERDCVFAHAPPAMVIVSRNATVNRIL